MQFKEFGDHNNPALILIHGYGISWRMWLPHIERFRDTYHVIAPALAGHDIETLSDFESVEASAEAISSYVEKNLHGRVFAICGASLGATIAIHILAQNRIAVEKAIIDAGPLAPSSKLYIALAVYTRLFQNWLLRKGYKFATKALYNSFFPREAAEDVIVVCSRMSAKTCRNVQRSAFSYALPISIQESQTDIVYWHGSKEAFLMQKSLDRFAKTLPHARIERFEGYDHGELSIGNPDIFVAKAREFFAR